MFHAAAKGYQNGENLPERVKVYEKLRNGIWVYNGLFHLIDSYIEEREGRKVVKFRLEFVTGKAKQENPMQDIEHSRIIPGAVKVEVWKRDRGRCVMCGSADNLHFDHIIPFSKGGSSLVVANIQLLCARHNLAKRDRIE